MGTSTPRLALSPSEAAEAIGVSRRTLYNVLASGQLPSRMLGSRRLILVTDLEAYLDGLGAA